MTFETGKGRSKTGKEVLKQEKDVLKQKKYVQKQDDEENSEKNPIFSMHFLSFLSRGKSRDGTGQAVKIPSCPVARFWVCPVVPLSRDNEETSVPVSQKVALSRPVGNATVDTHVQKSPPKILQLKVLIDLGNVH